MSFILAHSATTDGLWTRSFAFGVVMVLLAVWIDEAWFRLRLEAAAWRHRRRRGRVRRA